MLVKMYKVSTHWKMNKLYLTGIGIPANNDLVCLAEDFALCRCIYVYSPKSKIGECISFRKVVQVYVKFQVSSLPKQNVSLWHIFALRNGENSHESFPMKIPENPHLLQELRKTAVAMASGSIRHTDAQIHHDALGICCVPRAAGISWTAGWIWFSCPDITLGAKGGSIERSHKKRITASDPRSNLQKTKKTS